MFAPKVTRVCCILHNVCAAEGDIPEEEVVEEKGSRQDDRDDEDVADERELSWN